MLARRFQGWTAAVLTGSPDWAWSSGSAPIAQHTMWNGAIECRLLRLKIEGGEFSELRGRRGVAQIQESLRDTPGAKMFANRLGKNLKRLQSWARKNDVTCYRLYDADMPEYAFAIDLYRTLPDGSSWLYVQEYAAPDTSRKRARAGGATKRSRCCPMSRACRGAHPRAHAPPAEGQRPV